MVSLWENIPKKYQAQVDISAKVTDVGIYTLKAAKPPKFKLK
jgi:hypothetical protein